MFTNLILKHTYTSCINLSVKTQFILFDLFFYICSIVLIKIFNHLINEKVWTCIPLQFLLLFLYKITFIKFKTCIIANHK